MTVSNYHPNAKKEELHGLPYLKKIKLNHTYNHSGLVKRVRECCGGKHLRDDVPIIAPRKSYKRNNNH